MSKKHKNVKHVGQYTVVGTDNFFIAVKAIKHLQAPKLLQRTLHKFHKVMIQLGDCPPLEVWQ